MSSLDGLSYNAFAPHATQFPTVADYFGQGQALAQSVIDQQYQSQQRAALLAQQQQKAQLEALLGPTSVQQAQANLTHTGLENDALKLSTTPFSEAVDPGATALVSSTPIGSPSSTPSGSVSNISPIDDNTFSTTATVFASPQDRAKYDAAKRSGATELQALAVGDNQQGAWGANTGDPSKKYVAVSPDFMAANNLKPNDPITVIANGKQSLAYVGDKLPNNSSNGAGIDLNPGVASDLGVDPNNFKGQVTFKVGHGDTASDPIAVSQDGGALDRAIAATRAANPSTANIIPTGQLVDPRGQQLLNAASASGQNDPANGIYLNSPTPSLTDSSFLAGNGPSLDAPSFSSVSPSIPSTFAPIGNGQPIANASSPLSSSPVTMTRQQGYYTGPGQFVESNDPRVRTFRTVPATTPALAAEDARNLDAAQKLGLPVANYAINPNDPSGALIPQARAQLRADIANKYQSIKQAQTDAAEGSRPLIIPDASDSHSAASSVDPTAPFSPGHIAVPMFTTQSKDGVTTQVEDPRLNSIFAGARQSQVPVDEHVKVINGQPYVDMTSLLHASGQGAVDARNQLSQSNQKYILAQGAYDALQKYASLPASQRNGFGDNQALTSFLNTEVPGNVPAGEARRDLLGNYGFGDTYTKFANKFTTAHDPSFLSDQQIKDMLDAGKISTQARAHEVDLASQKGGAAGVARSALANQFSASGNSTAQSKTLSPQDQQAASWAQANPNDPRAAAIRQHLGL